MKLTLILAASLAATTMARAQGTAFTCQGRLNDGAIPANGNYDLRFALYDALAAGNVVAGPLTNSSTSLSNGLFIVTLDFGAGMFTGADRWLEVAIRTNGAADFAPLAPRQWLAPSPYAMHAADATTAASANAVSAGNVSGTLAVGQLPPAVVTNGAGGLSLSGTFAGDGGALTNLAGALPWHTITGPAVSAAGNTGSLLTGSQFTTVTLPVAPNLADIVRVTGAATPGWQIAQNAGQSITGTFLGMSGTNAAWTQALPGGTWKSVASSADGSMLASLQMSSTAAYYSTNGGAAWFTSPMPSGYTWMALASSADGRRLVAATGANGIFTSTNAGSSWQATTAPNGQWLSVGSSADGLTLVAGQNFNGPLYYSTNGGLTWTNATVTGISGYNRWEGVASSAEGRNWIAASYSGYALARSTDYGATWTALNAPQVLYFRVASSADGSRLFAGAQAGTIYLSTDGGATWNPTTAPTAPNLWASIACSADGTKIVAVQDGGAIYFSGNGGATWNPATAPSVNWTWVAGSADGTRWLASAYNSGVYLSQFGVQSATTTGATGYLSGGKGVAVELQYVGNGQWQVISHEGTIFAY